MLDVLKSIAHRLEVLEVLEELNETRMLSAQYIETYQRCKNVVFYTK